jgi:hypothetical protein
MAAVGIGPLVRRYNTRYALAGDIVGAVEDVNDATGLSLKTTT